MIRQLETPCWSVPGLDDEREPHFDDEAAALKALKEAQERGVAATCAPWTLAYRCWVIECDGECGMAIDEDDEGFIHHCKTRAEAEDSMLAWKWVYVEDLVFCVPDAPEGGVIPAPSPAELEAAGQLTLPDVTR